MLPNCIGFVDGSHVNLEQAPALAHASEYYSRKQRYGLHLQVVCDWHQIIRHIKVGRPASTHDAKVFNECDLGKHHGMIGTQGLTH